MADKRPLLVLALDETLIDACPGQFDREPDVVVGHYSVMQRPGLQAFLQGSARYFDLAVWALAELNTAPNFRAIEIRHWRQQMLVRSLP